MLNVTGGECPHNLNVQFQVQLDAQMMEDLAIDADLLRLEMALSFPLKLGR